MTNWSTGPVCAFQNAEWLDLGYPEGAARATTIAASERDVFVGTVDGLLRRSIDDSAGWRRAGLEGRYIRTVLTVGSSVVVAGAGRYDDTTLPGTFHRSVDGAHSWCSSGGDLFRYAYKDRDYAIPMEQLIRDPGDEGGGLGVLYANMSGSSIAASNDGGATWRYVWLKPEPYGGGPCVIHIAGETPDVLYQGGELPLDMAWIQSFDASSRQGALNPPAWVVRFPEISNRRPNSFASSRAAPSVVYVGLEGALIRLEPLGWSWVYQHPESGTGAFGRYTYVKFTWIDPCSPSHLVFGGLTQSRDSFDLYETFDGGATLVMVPPPTGFESAHILAGAAAGMGGRDLALLLRDATRQPETFRVLMRRYGP